MIANVLFWLVIGAIIGMLATSLMHIRTEYAMASNVVVGMIGGFVGGALSVTMASEHEFSFISLLVAAICAVALIALVRAFSHRGGRPIVHH